MKKIILFFSILFILRVFIQACTIGVASASVTSDNRPIIWKNRGVSNPTYVHNFTEDMYKYIGVGNEGSNYIWMGINEVGFAILNAVAKPTSLIPIQI